MLTLREGIPSRVLPIQWPNGIVPSKLSNFESQAREHRHELWRKACHSDRLSSLFLGHHQDDQAETVFMRLINQHGVGTFGLRGIKDKSFLHRSNRPLRPADDFQIDSVPVQDLLDNREWNYTINARHARKDLDGRIMILKDEISLYRPLLSFPKARLISTCQSNGVPFVIDPTNFDPTLTLRNACRHIFTSYKLPKAFQTESLINLSAKASTLESTVHRTSNMLLSETRILSFDLRSGTIRICLPDPRLPIWSSVDLRIASYYLRRILYLVGAGSSRQLDFVDLLPVAKALFSHLQPPAIHESGEPTISQQSTLGPGIMTVAGVLITPSNESREGANRRRLPTNTDIQRQTYILTSQLPSRSELRLMSQRLPSLAQLNSETTQMSTSATPFSPRPHKSASTISFNNQFYFHLQLPSSSSPPKYNYQPQQPSKDQTIANYEIVYGTTENSVGQYILRPLHPEDISTLPKLWRRVLRDAAPGKTRFTLPAVVRVPSDEGNAEPKGVADRSERTPTDGKQESVFALPTLGLWRDSQHDRDAEGARQGDGQEQDRDRDRDHVRDTDDNTHLGFSWKISYMSLDPEVLRLVKWGPNPSPGEEKHSDCRTSRAVHLD